MPLQSARSCLIDVCMILYCTHAPTELFQLGAREGVIIAIASVFLGCFTVHTIIILCLNSKYIYINFCHSYQHWYNNNYSIMIIIAEGHPTVSRIISNKHIQFLMTLILFMFFIACGTLLTTFALISNGAYWTCANSRLQYFVLHCF